jgi:integrase
VGLDRDQARALLAAADMDRGPARPRGAAAIRLLLHQGLRVDELARADVADLGHNRGHRILTVTRKGGHRVALVLPPATTAALDAYLATRVAAPAVATAAVAGRPPVASADMTSTRTSADVAGPAVGHQHRWPPGPGRAVAPGPPAGPRRHDRLARGTARSQAPR